MILPLLMLDAPRYALGSTLVWAVDFLELLWSRIRGNRANESFHHCPSVCVVIAGLNEAATIRETVESLWGTYPRMEVVVVDDGSDDGMAEEAHQSAQGRPGVTVLRKPSRGGKSSALNFALPFTNAEIIVCVDADSSLGPDAIWEIVQPFVDPDVAAVSGTILARNAFYNVCTQLQACEYLRNIFLGRILTSRLNILGIVSGAFGAYRLEALRRLGGWDVGPGEDGDLSLRLRKSGYRIDFAPYAQCFTNVPTSFRALWRQRRRWEWAVVTFECRKHIDMANLFSPNFRWSNLALLVDCWLYSIVLPFAFWAYVLHCFFHPHEELVYQFVFYYVVCLFLELVQLGLIGYYSTDPRRDFCAMLLCPLMPLYHLSQRLVTGWAVLEEMLFRRSFQDGFVPEHVRRVTWHW